MQLFMQCWTLQAWLTKTVRKRMEKRIKIRIMPPLFATEAVRKSASKKSQDWLAE
jgi:hypothetical protein